MLRQLEPELLVADLVTALKQRIDRIYMQRMKLPMAETLLHSASVWKWCMALQPPILLNKMQLGDIALGVMALVCSAADAGTKEDAIVKDAAKPSNFSSSPTSLPSSPIRFIITGRPGDGKTLSVAIVSLLLQDHFKHTNMTSSIIIPVFPSCSSPLPHACDVLKCINHQLREGLPNSFRRPEPPHSSLRSLKLDLTYYTAKLLEMSDDAVIVIIIDDVHLLSHSVACVEQSTYGYFLPVDLSSRVITVVTCEPSSVSWLQSLSLAPPPHCVVGLQDGFGASDCRVGIISAFAARHLKCLKEAEGLVMQSLASDETRSEYIRDLHHFRSVFAAAVDDQSRLSVLRESSVSSLSARAKTNLKWVVSSTAFEKWLGSDGDLPDKGSDNAFFFSHASMSYVRGSCAALESLHPPNDVRTVSIVKRMLDAGLADAFLIDSVTLNTCLVAVLGAASQAISKHIVARIAALVAVALLSLQELRDVLTLDGTAVGELDASVSAYSIKQFPLRVLDDVLTYLAILGVLRMMNDVGGVLVAPPHIKPLLLQWAATHGFTELDAHTAIGEYLHFSSLVLNCYA